jgi:hypothetical protein
MVGRRVKSPRPNDPVGMGHAGGLTTRQEAGNYRPPGDPQAQTTATDD